MRENFIQVAIPVPMRQLFTYKLPESIDLADIVIGQRVIVPFSHRTVVAVVISMDQVLPENVNTNKVKAVISINKDQTQFSKALLSLLTLCANYYQHPIGEVMQAALPVLLRQIDTPTALPNMQWQPCKNIDEALLTSIAKKAPKQHQLYQLLLQHTSLSWSELRTLGYSKAQLNTLEKKQLIKQVEVVMPTYHWQDGLNDADKLALSTEQAITVAAINNTIDEFSCQKLFTKTD